MRAGLCSSNQLRCFPNVHPQADACRNFADAAAKLTAAVRSLGLAEMQEYKERHNIYIPTVQVRGISHMGARCCGSLCCIRVHAIYVPTVQERGTLICLHFQGRRPGYAGNNIYTPTVHVIYHTLICTVVGHCVERACTVHKCHVAMVQAHTTVICWYV